MIVVYQEIHRISGKNKMENQKKSLTERIAQSILEFSGRMLSEEKAKIAENNKDRDKPAYSSDTLKEYLFTKDGNLVRERVAYRYKTTPDISHGWEIQHTGYYPVAREVHTYDSDRLLIERVKCTWDDWNSTTITLKYRNGDFCWNEKKVSRTPPM